MRKDQSVDKAVKDLFHFLCKKILTVRIAPGSVQRDIDPRRILDPLIEELNTG